MSIEFDDCYSHDDNDNLQMDAESNSYAYDYRNRLIEVQNNESATIAEYTLDALGRRCNSPSICWSLKWAGCSDCSDGFERNDDVLFC